MNAYYKYISVICQFSALQFVVTHTTKETTLTEVTSPNTNLATGSASGPQLLASGDYNQDGEPDLLNTNNSLNTASVFYSLGTPGAKALSPTTSNSLLTGNVPGGTVTGDFNGDGKIDAAVANQTGGTISIYLNTGNGLPVAANQTLTGGTTPTMVITGDFTGDGKLDLAVSNQGATSTNGIFIFVNNGSTSAPFPTTRSQALTTGNGPVGLATADFSQDGRLDLAVANKNSNTMFVYNNNGSGTTPFPTTNSYSQSTSTTPLHLASGDFDGNGKPDLVVTNSGTTSAWAFFNSGTTLQAASLSIATGTTPTVVVSADFNTDGKPDLAITNQGSHTVTVYLNSNWSFPGISSTLTPGVTPIGLVAADFNGDGKPDLATANFASSNISVFINSGTALPTIPTNTLTGGNGPLLAASGDFNGDNLPDLIVTNQGSSGANGASIFTSQTTVSTGTSTINQGNGQVGVKINLAPGTTSDAFTIVDTNGNNLVDIDGTGKATFGSPGVAGSSFSAKSYDTGSGLGPYGAATADFNGDGLADTAVANTSTTTVTVYTNGGYFYNTTSTLNVGSNPVGVATGDFNGDGRADLAVVNSVSNTVSIFINTGTGFAASPNYAVATGAAGPWGIVAADFNNDGRTDIATGNHTTTGAAGASVFYNNGSGFSGVTATNLTTGNGPYGVGAGDFNGDGRMDLVVSNSTANTVSVFHNNGTSLPTTATSTLAAGTNPLYPVVADFNGDGKMDLAMTNQTAGGVSIYINNGSALPTSVSYSLNAGGGPLWASAADFNGDGKMDLVVTNYGSGGPNGIAVYTNTGTALPVNGSIILSAASNPTAVITPDVNNDGKPDLLVTVLPTNIVSVFLNTSASPARLKIAPVKPTESGLVIQGAAGQAANYMQLQTSTGTTFFEVRAQNGSPSVNYSPSNAILYIGADPASARSINAAGSVNVNGADYAEYIPWSGEKPPPGSIVSYKGSNYVVSSPETAAFVGNDKFSESTGLLVTFAGQVPVRVTGPVTEGDILVPNGDGTAKAVTPTQATVSDALNKVAVAQESNSDPGVKLVNAAVGTTASLPSNLQGSSGDFSDLNVGGNATIGGDLTVTGTATIGELHVTGSAQFSGDITVGGHIITASGEPTTELQVAAGTAADVSIDGNDTTGTITITTGGSPTTGELLKVLFSQSYGAPPRIILSPSNDNAAGLKYFKGNTSTTDFMFNALDAPQANTVYKFDYFIAQ